MSTQTTEKKANQIRKVTYAGLLLLALLCVIVLLLVLRFKPKQISVKAGESFPSDVTAPYTGTDSFLTDRARQTARENATVVYVTSTALVNEQKTAVEDWFTRFEGWIGDMEAVWDEGAETLDGKARFRGLNVTWRDLVSEQEMTVALVRRGLADEISVTVAYLILDKYMPANTIHPVGEKISADDFKKAFTDVVYPLMETGIDAAGLSRAKEKAKTDIKKKSLLSAMKTEVAGKLVEKYVCPTITVDETATEANRRMAASTVADVRITRGQVLFKKGDTVTAEDITHLTSLGLLKGASKASAFSFPALLIYGSFCVFMTGLWILLFEKRLFLRTGQLLALIVAYALTALFAFGFSYLEAGAAPVLFAFLCAAEEGKKEHSAGALIFSVLLLPVLLDTDVPFGAEGFVTGASLLMGGLCASCMLYFSKDEKRSILPAGILGGTVMGIIRLCPLLWEGASASLCMMGFGFPFLGGLLAAILAVLARPLFKRLREI